MKPEEQRIAIHQACGYQLTKTFTGIYWKKLNETLSLSDFMRGTTTPDYLNDLNAIHEAEKVKEMHWNQKWVETVVEIALKEAAMKFDQTDGWDWVLLVSRLSAAQRAEVFLKTLSLWKDEN